MTRYRFFNHVNDDPLTQESFDYSLQQGNIITFKIDPETCWLVARPPCCQWFGELHFVTVHVRKL